MLCALSVMAARKKVAPYLTTEVEMATEWGCWFIVLFIGATSTNKRANIN